MAEEDWPDGPGVTLRLDLDGYEGPIDVLLVLARQQKVDLTRISILDLAEQYLAFIAEARRLDLEIAADYLVMAAWLVYLKSRLLLPDEEDDEEPSGPELAEALAFQLRRLQAMQEKGRQLLARPLLGREVFARGEPQDIEIVRRSVYEVSLFDLLSAYGESRRRASDTVLEIAPSTLYSIAEAIERLSGLGGGTADWKTLFEFLPPEAGGGIRLRSAIASTFVAGLELARMGRLQFRQMNPFGPIYIRGRSALQPVQEATNEA